MADDTSFFSFLFFVILISPFDLSLINKGASGNIIHVHTVAHDIARCNPR